MKQSSFGPVCHANVTANVARRRGKTLVLFAIMCRMILGILGLVIDGSMLHVKHRVAQ